MPAKLVAFFPKTKRSKIIVGICLLAFGIGVSLIWLATNERDDSNHPEVVTYSTNTPSEKKPGSDFDWQGRSIDPKKITIPSIEVDGYIQKVGVDQNSQIAVPNNVHIAGWFVDSVRPGAPGLSIIDGHVDGRQQNEAIFGKLSTIKTGAEISIEFGNGSSKKFKVTDTFETTSQDTPSLLYSQKPGTKSQLNLVTCVGSFNPSTNTYDKRFVVYAESIN